MTSYRIAANKDNYESILKWMGKRVVKNYANNTIAVKDNEVITIKYHDNPIVVLSETAITFSSCGWFTSTTKERLNWFLHPLGFSISQVNHAWFIYRHGEWHKPMGIFTGNCILDLTTMQFTGLQKKDNRVKELNRIKKYAKNYIEKLLSGKIPSPDSGDCWHCYMTFPDSWDHIDSHMKERYYVPSLLTRSVMFKDVAPIVKAVVSGLWHGTEDMTDVKTFMDVSREQLTKSLIAYMLHCYDVSKSEESNG